MRIKHSHASVKRGACFAVEAKPICGLVTICRPGFSLASIPRGCGEIADFFSPLFTIFTPTITNRQSSVHHESMRSQSHPIYSSEQNHLFTESRNFDYVYLFMEGFGHFSVRWPRNSLQAFGPRKPSWQKTKYCWLGNSEIKAAQIGRNRALTDVTHEISQSPISRTFVPNSIR